MTQEELLDLTTEVAGTAVALSAGILLLLWRQGLIPDDGAGPFAKRVRDLATRMEGAGLDGPASELWTAANLIERPSPKGRGKPS